MRRCYKKLLFFGVFFAFANFSHLIDAQAQEQLFNTDLGKVRIFEIMNNGPAGLASFYKNIKLAETLNLTLDLNLAEISDRFDCMLVIGRKFLNDAFDKLISPKDTSSLLADRQHAVSVIVGNLELKRQLHNLLHKAAQHEAVVLKFMQEKQDVLDKLPKGYINNFCTRSTTVQAFNQASWLTNAGLSSFALIKTAPYYEYLYKKPADLIKDKKNEDFYPQLDPDKKGVSGFLYNAGQVLKTVPDNIMRGQLLGKKSYVEYAKHMQKRKDEWPETEAGFIAKAEELANQESQLAKVNVAALGSWDKDRHDDKIRNLASKKLRLEEDKQWHADEKLRFDASILNIKKSELLFDRLVIAGYVAAYTAVAAGIGIVSYSAYKMYTTHMEGLKMRDSLYAMNQLIVIAEEIEALCKAHGIKNKFVMSSIQDEDSLALIATLKSYPYTNDTSIFVPSSVTRTYIYEVYEKDMHLAPIFAAVAEMDALHAVADKMVATQDAKNKFCFAKFIDNSTPMIKMDFFWNLLVGKPIANSLSTNRKVILTGPNAGGKSTSIRAILQNIVFAQTFGVAAATTFELTQFDVLHSFINVSDDILGGKSLFATEVQRAQDIMKRMKRLRSNEKYFFALDELFTGTNAEDGEMCAYTFIENIASYPQTQFIYATHFNRLKEIGAHNKDCVNYKIDAPAQNVSGAFIRDSKGKLMYPYTMCLGANNISVAKEIAHDAGLL
jgi:hypothetical protein